MHEILTFFENSGVLRTTFIFSNLTTNIWGKLTPKFMGFKEKEVLE
jgi:hypothetical protein